MNTETENRYAKYQRLVFDWPAERALHVTMNRPDRLNSADRTMHRELAVDEAQLQDKALEVAKRLDSLAPTAIRFTKYALNNWLRQAGPIFDASLALEWMGWKGPEVQEAIHSFREKRPANFNSYSPI